MNLEFRLVFPFDPEGKTLRHKFQSKQSKRRGCETRDEQTDEKKVEKYVAVTNFQEIKNTVVN